MAGVVKAMDAAMKGMNLEKISGLMDKFEQQFEDLGEINFISKKVYKLQQNILQMYKAMSWRTQCPQLSQQVFLKTMSILSCNELLTKQALNLTWNCHRQILQPQSAPPYRHLPNKMSSARDWPNCGKLNKF
jgi:hypothetical protein